MKYILRLAKGYLPFDAKNLMAFDNVKILDESNKMLLIECKELPKHVEHSEYFESVSPEVHFHHCATIQLGSDSDIDLMSEEEAKAKLKEIRGVALWWASQEDDDRCWLDDIKVLEAILPHGSVNFSMPADLDFIENCIKFKKTRCPNNPKLHEW